MRLIRLLALCAAFLAPLPLAAQQAATLVADSVAITGESTLVAQGNVEVFYQGRRVQAQRIIYNQAADSLSIEGPIVLKDDSGTFILADQAELSADLTQGVLTSARLVLNQQLQLAATEISRIGGRYTRLGRTVASSCQVCAENPTPLWEIRASQVVHDDVQRQIYFSDAQLRIAGMPVFWLPRLRMPDPRLTRASGVLTPSLRTTSGLGTGLKLPYFITLGDSRDLTLTPYVTTKGGRTLELRYRQAFSSGGIEVSGAWSRDELLPDDLRGHVLATGAFELPRDFDLTFRIEGVSDPAYYLDYGLPERDRLDSRVEVSRTRRNEHIEGRLIYFHSIRDGESNATLPSLVGDLTFHRRFSAGPLGGEAGLRLQTHSQYRSSTLPFDTDIDADTDADGRDMARASVRVDWRRNWVLPAGIVGTLLGEATADVYQITQDDIYDGTTTRLHGAAAMEFRWPWVRAGRGGAQHVVEPVAQLIWSPSSTEDLPNEDSALVEFDEGNLFSLNRFPGSDATERGTRANLGISWTRFDPAGWSLGLTAGRVIRTRDTAQFGGASGLDGQRSDWLVAMQLGLNGGLMMTNRVLFDDDLEVTKAELRMDLQRDDYGLAASYVRLMADPLESRDTPVSELTLDGRYRVTDFWTAKASSRYDVKADRTARAGVGLEFRNECMSVDLSLSRRFTSSTSVQPTTDFGLSVDLLGFGSGTAPGPSRRCGR
ncbi:LPS-assembly protein LptD [Fertoebacter nigrum]|uniref:LPS-assembly protein LptD n=1 Tax=Fertoeibacter niger TaxID=2656921 RepID=A0A8X8GX94_9RHOB|nr:LPS assembly protein LptD [Fertoeibacter niger]NUB42850.1 LPS-assembly protein LptD [Fertoeibacter niger]